MTGKREDLQNRTEASFTKIKSVLRNSVLLSVLVAPVVLSGCAGTVTANGTGSPTPPPVAPSITTQPTSQTVTAGQPATFTVAATGTSPLSYQWLKNGVNLAGATSASYTTPATATSDSGAKFDVVVSNSAGTVTSAMATLTVNAAAVAPSITTQPASQTVTAGQAANFAVVATGTAPLSYQWGKNGAAISGATSATYSTPATTSSDNGAQFTVVVSNSVGSATSAAATLTVTAVAVAPTITTEPASQTVTAGQTATFTVVATGAAPLSYQWNKNGAAISGATSSSYTTPATTSSDNGAQFTVVVSNSAGSITSNAATLTVNSAALTVTTTSLPNGTVGQAYSAQLNATGGTSPYSWSVSSGSLPAGLSLSLAGLISGIPTTAGSSTFTAMVSDASSQSATGNFTLTVASPTANTCTLYVSPSGSDSNPGTLSSPWQTAQRAFSAAAPGDVICFRGGTYPQYQTPPTYNQTMSASGTAANPITVQNYPGEVALIQGSTHVTGSYITFKGTITGPGTCMNGSPCGLRFEGSTGYVLGGFVICCATSTNPHNIISDHLEIFHGTYHAGYYVEGCDHQLTNSYIHDNGTTDINEDEGVYWSAQSPACSPGHGGLIANNIIEHNYSKGLSMYNGGSSTDPAYVVVTGNTVVNNGRYGIDVYGDHNIVVNNIFYNNGNVGSANAQATVYTGTSQTLDHNLSYNPANPGQQSWFIVSPACCVTNDKSGDPLFVNPTGLDWHVLASSPAIGFSNMNYVQPVDKDGVSRTGTPVAGAYQQ